MATGDTLKWRRAVKHHMNPDTWEPAWRKPGVNRVKQDLIDHFAEHAKTQLVFEMDILKEMEIEPVPDDFTGKAKRAEMIRKQLDMVVRYVQIASGAIHPRGATTMQDKKNSMESKALILKGIEEVVDEFKAITRKPEV